MNLRCSPIDPLKFMLPDFLVDYFEVVSTTNTEEILKLYFKKKQPKKEEFDTVKLVSNWFLEKITIQDFPLRGKFMYCI